MTTTPGFDPDVVAQIPTRPAVIRAYFRHCFLPIGGPPDPSWVSATIASRWQTPEGTLYLAEEEETVWAEYCRWSADTIEDADPTGGVGLGAAELPMYAAMALGEPLPARALFEVMFAVPRLADLKALASTTILGAVGITEGDLVADDFGPCPLIAQLGAAAGWSALRAPSAALDDGTTVAVLPGNFPPLTAWAMLRPRARPTIGIAYFTRYRALERPTWLR